MKILTILSLLAATIAQAGEAGGPEEKIFTSLQSEGVFLHHTYSANHPGADTSTFYLDSISCTRIVSESSYRCSLGDTARPFERKELQDDNSKVIYDALVASGIEPIAVPFMREDQFIVSASKLQCTKTAYTVPAIYDCQRLKPLVG